jgi:hypothetical protein
LRTQLPKKHASSGQFNQATAGEIAGLTEKTVLADNDVFLIEDSAASNAKKFVKKSNLGVSSLSNVIFSWNGSEYWVKNVGGLYSSETSLTLDPGIAATFGYTYFAVVGATYRNILISKFKKIAGISTITIQARLWSDSADAGEETILNVDIGGQANTVKSVTSTTPAWVTAADIDVSSLTNGTTYDITIQLKNEGAGGISYCSAVILIAS